MRLALISLLMIPLAVGCSTKSAVEKAIEQCVTGCTNYADFMVACGFELGATTEAYCDGQCAGAESAYDAGCENAYDALMDCRVSLNWASAECSNDVIESKLSACAEQDTALETCADADGGADGHAQDHDHEVISTVVLTFISQADDAEQVIRWVEDEGQDVDIDLAAGTVYDLSVSALNELETPAEDITPEIADEADEHQLFFTGSAVDDALVTHEYVDFDEGGLPLGLENEITAVTAGSGDLTVTLRHLALQDGNKVKREGMAEDVAGGGLSAIAGEGENVFSINFSVTVQ